MNIIVKMKFGSHLYGTNTKDSDLDYKGVLLPTKEQIFLNKVPKSYSEKTGNDNSKNTKDDIETEMYSLHYFLKLACKGQTVALDMLHAPDNMILETSNIWKSIVAHKVLFYTKNMQAFLGYAVKQCGKYSCKGSRLNNIEQVLKVLKENI